MPSLPSFNLRKKTIATVAGATAAAGLAVSAAVALPAGGAGRTIAEPNAQAVAASQSAQAQAEAPASASARAAAAQKAAAQKAAQERAAAAAKAAANRSQSRATLTGSPQQIAAQIVPADQLASFSEIISHESGWNVYATNPSSGAYGLGQALPGSKMASAGADWRTNPATQIRWALDYMNQTYGSPNAAWAFWQAHNWY
ncbi:transglycosylase SLT domain-containing protein [Streptacidiphilus monticola]|uniref:Transglycosylase SLT domain-containing protein n=1 Tax=Streptacidiphilus monticola TaxID=2161674 RepID=A0ABW1G8C0_9ACTN